MIPLTAITDKANRLCRIIIDGPPLPSEEKQIAQSIKDAGRQLKCAEIFFDQTTGSEAVDYATYNLMAARAKYSYLVKLAKEKNIRL